MLNFDPYYRLMRSKNYPCIISVEWSDSFYPAAIIVGLQGSMNKLRNKHADYFLRYGLLDTVSG